MNISNERILKIKPQIELGFLKFGDSINKVISELRDRAEFFLKIDIILGEIPSDPIYIILFNEGIKLRFDPNFQLLDLIEIDTQQDFPQRFFSIIYKNEYLIKTNEKSNFKNSENLSYNKINLIFGPSQLPSSLEDNKYVILKYDGISFLFLNNSQESDKYIKYQNLHMLKIVLFGEKTLKESISPENGIPNSLIYKNVFENENKIFNIKIEYDKGIILTNPFLEKELNNIQNSNYTVSTNNINNNSNNNFPYSEINNSVSREYNIEMNVKNSKDDESTKNTEINNFNINDDVMNNNNQNNMNSIDIESGEYDYDHKPDSKLLNNSFGEIDYKNPISICFGENYDSILFKLKNPNYIFYKSNNTKNSEYDNISLSNNQDETDDFYLNYYSLGFDLLIDGTTLKLKKIKLHTNNPFSTEFGIWNRAPFSLELNKILIKKLNEIIYDGNSSSRKVSEDYNSINIRNSLNTNNINSNFNNNSLNEENQSFKVNNNFISSNNNLEIKNDFQIIESNQNVNNLSNTNNPNDNMNNIFNINNNCNLIYNINNFNFNNRKRREYKCSFDEKSFNSINESYISLSSNYSDNYTNYNITPNTFFIDIISKFNRNSYMVYHRCDQKLSMTIKYYCFDGLIFEVLENNTLSSITIFKTCNPLP